MKRIVSKIRRSGGRVLAGLGVLAVTAATAQADPGAVETAVSSAVTAAKTAGENVLVVAASIIGAFILFKLVKRAANKA